MQIQNGLRKHTKHILKKVSLMVNNLFSKKLAITVQLQKEKFS